MISAKFLWGNVLLGGKLQIGAKNSNFEIFESALYMKSVERCQKTRHVSGGGIVLTSFEEASVVNECGMGPLLVLVSPCFEENR